MLRAGGVGSQHKLALAVAHTMARARRRGACRRGRMKRGEEEKLGGGKKGRKGEARRL